MIARLSAWYLGLTGRERVLVSVAGGLAALVLLVYGIVLPVGNALDAAARRHGETVLRTGQLMETLDELAKPAPKAVSAGAPVDQLVATSAQGAGFVLQSNQPQGTDATQIAIPGAQATLVLAWLETLTQQGLSVEALTLTPAPDGSVSVSATLRRTGS